jgi:hypothetical protein
MPTCQQILSKELNQLMSRKKIIPFNFLLKLESCKHVCTLKGQCHEIFDFRFFHEIVSPKLLTPEYPNRPFRIFSKTRGDISTQCAPPVANGKNLQSEKF